MGFWFGTALTCVLALLAVAVVVALNEGFE
jgi:hypothetical protein